VVSDINQKLLKQCESGFSSQDLRTVNADVTKEESGTRLFAEVVGQFGKSDVLVNNAAIMDHYGGAGELDKALWDKVIAVNLTRPFIMTMLAVQHLLERTSKGTILNIGSHSSTSGGAAGKFKIMERVKRIERLSESLTLSSCCIYGLQAWLARIDQK
jgi:NAD(P)-dependent dehydrogenase (short-subunit alcohol dehydrogenase family)